MKKILAISLLIQQSIAFASQPSLLPFIWNKKVKVTILNYLASYQQSARIKASVIPMQEHNEIHPKNNNALQSFLALSKTISTDDVLPDELLIGAKLLLTESFHDQQVQQELHVAQTQSLAFAASCDEDKIIESLYNNFQKSWKRTLLDLLKNKTNIKYNPFTTDMHWLCKYPDLSSENSGLLQHATLAVHQINPFIDEEVTHMMHKRIMLKIK